MFTDYLNDREDLIKSWYMFTSPWPIVLIMVLYLLFSIILGPLFMKNRDPLQIKKTVLIYNVVQVIFNLWMCYKMEITKSIPYAVRSCTSSIDKTYENYLTEVSWWFFVNKIMDYMDTAFMVFRKKNNQINLLHLYHHPATMFVSWFHTKYGPGFHHIIAFYMNAVIHIIMYTYYFLAGLGPKFQKYLWWKKYLTTIQMIQFCIILAYLCVMYLTCEDFPISLCIFIALNPTILLILFYRFYLRTYQIKKK